MKRILLLAIPLAVIAAPVNATRYDIDYKGSVIDGQNNGIFGNVGTDLAGQAYDANFIFNMDQPGATISSLSGSYSSMGSGAAAPLSATLTLEGKVIEFSPADSREIQSTRAGVDQDITYYDQYSEVYTVPFYSNVHGDYISDDYHNYFTPFVKAPFFGNNYVYNVPPDDVATQGTPQNDSGGRFVLPDDSFGDLNVSQVSVTRLGALPEPTTWAMTIMGFGFIGWTIRRHKLPVMKAAY